jgi:hypothetical protein
MAEKILKSKTPPPIPVLTRICDILTNFTSGWHAHETLMYEVMQIAAEAKKSDSTMAFPMMPPMPDLKKPGRRPF